jgi:hypothetical protein
MGGDRSQKHLADSPAKSWPHSTHRECNEADKGAPVITIEIVRNTVLQFVRIDFVMNENSAIPSRVEQRLAAD